MGRLLRIPEVMARLGVSRSFVYRAIEQQLIPSVRIGGIVRVPEAELEAYLKRRTRRPKGAGGKDDGAVAEEA